MVQWTAVQNLLRRTQLDEGSVDDGCVFRRRIKLATCRAIDGMHHVHFRLCSIIEQRSV